MTPSNFEVQLWLIGFVFKTQEIASSWMKSGGLLLAVMQRNQRKATGLKAKWVSKRRLMLQLKITASVASYSKYLAICFTFTTDIFRVSSHNVYETKHFDSTLPPSLTHDIWLSILHAHTLDQYLIMHVSDTGCVRLSTTRFSDS